MKDNGRWDGRAIADSNVVRCGKEVAFLAPKGSVGQVVEWNVS